MNKRYNSIERIGVNVTESIFLNEFDWIFREQPIVDVGIDALVEQAENGEPKGKFIALQIKSGKGNFSVTSNRLIYYISNVHYNYWMNFDIPILLIAHLPETRDTFWIEISDKNIKPTSKQWKIEIPNKNKLNAKAKPLISKLLSKLNVDFTTIKIFNGENVDEDTLFDITEKVSCISDASESTIKTQNILEDLTNKTNEFNDRIKHHNKVGESISSQKVMATINSYAKQLNIFSKRLDTENQIFAETLATGIFAYEQVITMFYLLSRNKESITTSIGSIKRIPDAIDKTIDAVSFMRESFEKIPSIGKNLKDAKRTMLTVIDSILNDFKDAKSLILNLIESSNTLIGDEK